MDKTDCGLNMNGRGCVCGLSHCITRRHLRDRSRPRSSVEHQCSQSNSHVCVHEDARDVHVHVNKGRCGLLTAATSLSTKKGASCSHRYRGFVTVKKGRGELLMNSSHVAVNRERKGRVAHSSHGSFVAVKKGRSELLMSSSHVAGNKEREGRVAHSSHGSFV
jgi:hypothetical protein